MRIKTGKSSLKRLSIVLVIGIVTLSTFGGSNILGAIVTGPGIITAPGNITDDLSGATNNHQQAFDEAQGVLLIADLAVDGGIIPAGTIVNSHMIFLNPENNAGTTDGNVVWTFDGAILGVMSDYTGALEVASSAILGKPGTVYPITPFEHRGMERAGQDELDDRYRVEGNQIKVTMAVFDGGDWIRVITAARKKIDVIVDIKPGSYPNSINPNDNGVIPVAILSTGDFDATSVDVSTVIFGPSGAAESHGKAHLEDVDGDGDIDMVLHFRTQKTGIFAGDTEATLSGKTLDGHDFIGMDSIRTVPE